MPTIVYQLIHDLMPTNPTLISPSWSFKALILNWLVTFLSLFVCFSNWFLPLLRKKHLSLFWGPLGVRILEWCFVFCLLKLLFSEMLIWSFTWNNLNEKLMKRSTWISSCLNNVYRHLKNKKIKSHANLKENTITIERGNAFTTVIIRDYNYINFKAG